MIHNKRNRRNRHSTHVAVAAIAEVVEPRMLLSAAPVVQPAAALGTDATGTKELVIVAKASLSGYRTPETLKIDEIRLVGDEVHVYSTRNYGAYLPGQGQGSYYDYVPQVQSDPVTVTVPDRELNVVYYFANIDQPQSDLYYLRTFGTSTLLYRRADADGDSGWLTTDVDPGAGSTVGLDFVAAPAAPTGLVSSSSSATPNKVTLWFDESPTSESPGQRFVRQYNINFQNNGSSPYTSGATATAFDSQRYPMTDANGAVNSFGGTKTLDLPVGVYTWRVQVRDLPVFPDGNTGTNALATPWSEFSEPARFAVLASGEQIAVATPVADRITGIATIEWGPVARAGSYEIWINRVSDGAMVLHKTGLSGSSYETDALDPDNYRVWVRATRLDGTRTSWSKFKEFTVSTYVNIFRISGNSRGQGLVGDRFGTIHDTTPTIEWTPVPHSTQYKISLIDSAKAQAAATMKFASPEALQNFITVYTRTVAGSSSSHTIETPLTAGFYSVEITLSFSNGATTSSYGGFNLEPAGLPIPVYNLDGSFSWAAEDDAASYDVWVAYLGFEGLPPDDILVALPKWKFDTLNGVTSGTYRLPLDAPAGNYRIWIRPNFAAAGQTTKGAWRAPADFTSQGPLYRPLSVTVLGEKLTWESVPGATGYRVTYFPVNASGSSRISTTTALEFQIPDAVMDGAYTVLVESLGSGGSSHASTGVISVQHGTSPWIWNITKKADMIEWSPVPDAVSYEIQFTPENFRTMGNAHITTEPHFSLSSLEPGHYQVMVRALRSVNGHEFLTEWATLYFDSGINAPTNVRLNGNILTWDAQENATYYDVLIEFENGVFENINLDTGPITAVYPPRLLPYHSRGTKRTGLTSIDLSESINDIYSYDRTAIIKLSVQAIRNATIPIPVGSFVATPLVSEWSAPIYLPVHNAAWVDPIIETAPQPKPPAPSPVAGGENTIFIPTFSSLPSDVTSKHIYRNGNGEAIDLEYAERFQLRVTDLQTGVVRTFDDSQVPELLQMRDEYELPVLNLYPIAVYDIAITGATIPLATQLGLSNSVYKIESRVQYLPVILSATTSDPYKFLLTDTQPDHINVAATPWSDWSTPLEYTVLPDGQNILPISKSPGTIDPRPTFAWGSNTRNAPFELWVENRATKQRALHETLTDIHQFQSTTNLPPGQYDWWVRIVGTEGARKGWSAKQSLEIFAPAISSTVVAETADATPVVSWTAVTGAQSYVVTLTSTATGNVIYTANAAANTTSHRVATTLPNDTYTVSIQALLPNGARSAPGVADSGGGFVLKRMVVGAAPKNVIITSSKVSWQAVTDATKYAVWINYVSPAGKTERIFRQNAFGTDISLPASLTSRAGEYRVWIRAIRSEAGQDYVGRWSDVKTLTVGSSPASLNASALTLVMSDLATTGLQL